MARLMPIRQPSLRRLLSAWALLGFAYFGVQTVLQNLYLLRLGYGPEFIGVLTGSGQLLWALGALPASWAGRRFGLRGAIIAGWILSALGNGLVLFVESVPEPWRVPWLFVWWAVGWLGAALNSVNNLPYVMALAGPEERNYVFAAQQGVLALMAFAGSLAAGFLSAVVTGILGAGDPVAPYRYTLWLAPPVYMLIVVLLMGLEPASEPAHHAPTGERPRAPLGLLGLFTLVVFMQTAGDGSTRTFLNVYLDRGLGVSTAQIGSTMGLAQLLSVAAALVAPRLMSRWGAARAYGLGTLGVAACVALIAGVPQWLVAAGGYMGVMTVFSVVGPARNVFSQQIVAPRWRTTTAALSTIGLATGWAVMAIAGGYVIALVGFAGLFGASAALAGLSALVTLAYLRHRTHADDARIGPEGTKKARSPEDPAL